MDVAILTLIIFIVIGLIIGIFLITRKLNSLKKEAPSDKILDLLQKQIGNLTQQVNTRLSEQDKTIREQMQESTRKSWAISEAAKRELKEVTEKLTKLDDTNKRVENFAEQLQSLENILKNPKHRGVLGEYFLETILSNILPKKNYKLQYQFKNGETVDAVIFIDKETVVPVDAKFSLETYNKIQTETNKERRTKLTKQFKQDLKNRIDETSKYVRPAENTTTFAFMFIPAEGLYYNLLGLKVGTSIASEDLMQYAFGKNVIIVSPNSFFAYLQTVVEGLRRLEIQEKAKEIQKYVKQLQTHLDRYDENMQKLGKHLGTTVGAYNTSYKEFKKVDKDAAKITGKDGTIEPMLLDRPQEFEEK